MAEFIRPIGKTVVIFVLLESIFSSKVMKFLTTFQLMNPPRVQRIPESIVSAVPLHSLQVLPDPLLSHPSLYCKVQLRTFLLCSHFVDPIEQLRLLIS